VNSKIITVSKKGRRKITAYLSAQDNSDYSNWLKINNRNGLAFQFTAFDERCRIFVSNEERGKQPRVMFVWLDDKYEDFMLKAIDDCKHMLGTANQ
jgi:hypothetical protein